MVKIIESCKKEKDEKGVDTYSTDASHRMMNPTRSKSALHDFKASSFTKNQIRSRYTHVLKCDMSMSVRSVIVAEYGEHPFERDTRCMGGHQDDRLLPVWIRIVRIGLSHDDVYLTAGIAGAT